MFIPKKFLASYSFKPQERPALFRLVLFDGLAITFGGTAPPFCSLTDAGNRSGSLDCVPGFDDAGTYPITIIVTDSSPGSLSSWKRNVWRGSWVTSTGTSRRR